MPEVFFGQLWTLPEHFSVKVVSVQCSPRVPTTGRDFCHPRRLCPVWQSHIEARGHQPHHRGTSALISDGHYPQHVCTLLCTNQTQQLVQADNPELSLYRGQTQSQAELRSSVVPGLVVRSGSTSGYGRWTRRDGARCPGGRCRRAPRPGALRGHEQQPLPCRTVWEGILHPSAIRGS